MFGLTIEKLFVVALIASVIIGPRRLPEYAGRARALLRRLTVTLGDAARRTEQEAGVASLRQEWTALDPRQYDPRRIIRDAWAAGDLAASTSVPAGRTGEDTGADAVHPDAAHPDAAHPDAGDAPTLEPAGAWVVAGSSGHPRRVWVPAED
ncbi:twin-arginine translocase TatA/TatE family subunit [Microbacterium sp. NPDC089320]|uniref:twin-arginine translocase TatA/TatE family subunit n=1 Tax=Microbacterium sp. NPDC089320 TaxID=3155182 RepID=UPI0034180A19